MSTLLVQRTAFERTAKASFELLQKEVPDWQHISITETPFHAAVRKSLSLGLEKRVRWLVCIDGDIFPSPGALQNLVQKMEAADSSVFMIQGRILDKLWGGAKDGGPRVYRGSLLGTALDFVPSPESAIPRPEAATILKMKELGYGYIQLSEVFGIHDYDQYYHDIRRKVYAHCVKHAPYVELLMKYWERMASSDEDFRIAHSAAKDFRLNAKSLDFLNAKKAVRQETEGQVEKPDLVSFSMNQVSAILNSHIEPPEFLACERLRERRGTHLHKITNYLGSVLSIVWKKRDSRS